METKYHILLPVHTFERGEHRGADEFPDGTDFERLKRLKVVHPIDGSPVPVDNNDLDGWKTRALTAEKRNEELSGVTPTELHKQKIEELTTENERLLGSVREHQQALETMKTDYDQKLSSLGVPGEAMKTAVAERDAAIAERDELLKRLNSGEGTDKGSESDTTRTWTYSKIMQLDVATIDAGLESLGITILDGANKQQKAQILADSNKYGGPKS